MNLLNQYFEGLTFRYIEEKQGYAIYGASIYSQLAGDKQRYVLAFVPAHLAIQTSAKLSELPWRNLQTRLCLKTTYRIKPQVWKFPHELPSENFQVSERGKTYTTYKPDDRNFPFEMLLINNPKKKSIYQYPNTVNIHWAIDQFSTVFNYIGESQPIQLTEFPSLQTQEIQRPPPAGNPMASWFGAQSPDFELID